ncbi:MAG: DUF4238 domain-containing protein [Bacteroidales bacterium]
MSKNKKQHYIPQFLLKRFATTKNSESIEGESIYRLDKLNMTIQKKGIGNCAYENYYYSFIDNEGNINHKIEQLLSQFESAALVAFRKIDKYLDFYKRLKTVNELSDEEKIIIKYFIFLSLVRVPAVFGEMKRKLKLHEEEMDEKYDIEYSDDRVRNNAIKLLVSFTNPNESKVFNLLKIKAMTILYCRKSIKRFIIGDNPVFLLNDKGPNGLAYTETEVYFPISSSSCIVLQDNIKNTPYLYIDQVDYIDQINRRIVDVSSRYVFSENEETLKELIVKKAKT